MAKLNDFFVQDMNSVFFNVDEFGTEVDIDGTTMVVIIDNEKLDKYKQKNGEEGLSEAELLFYVAESEFEEPLFIDKRLEFNHENYWIQSLKTDNRMYEVVLSRYGS